MSSITGGYPQYRLPASVPAAVADEYCGHLLRGAAKSVAVERPAKMDVEVVVQLAVAASVATIVFITIVIIIATIIISITIIIIIATILIIITLIIIIMPPITLPALEMPLRARSKAGAGRALSHVIAKTADRTCDAMRTRSGASSLTPDRWIGRRARANACLEPHQCASGERRMNTGTLQRSTPRCNAAQHAARRAEDARTAQAVMRKEINSGRRTQPRISGYKAH
jgi:hypothetical protein